jgi:hypothetical protein
LNKFLENKNEKLEGEKKKLKYERIRIIQDEFE